MLLFVGITDRSVIRITDLWQGGSQLSKVQRVLRSQATSGCSQCSSQDAACTGFTCHASADFPVLTHFHPHLPHRGGSF